MKKVIIGIIILLLTNCMGVFAEEKTQSKDVSDGNLKSDSYISALDFEEIMPVNISESVLPNRIEKEYKGKSIEVTEELSLNNNNNTYAISENTDPNNAYLVENDNIMQGFIETESEMRWYGFILNEKSKASILLQMVGTLDADIYMFKLNGNQLELLGGSAIEGSGEEYYTEVLDAGVYYFAISGYSGTGKFGFAYYQSSKDVDYELNDLAELAVEVPLNTEIIGVIDQPSDFDYYKITLTKPAVMTYSISSSKNYTLDYYKGGTIFEIEDNLFKFNAGTYYFVVYSKDGTYDSENEYNINFNKIGELADDNSAQLLSISEGAKIVFQSNNDGSKCYVNGNVVDINYKYYEHFSDQGGFQTYDIQIMYRNDVRAFIGDEYSPDTAYFRYGTKSNMDIKEKNLLELYLWSDKDTPFYFIHCLCSGGYAANNLWEDMSSIHVFIDPDTGKLVDIETFNYFYEFAQGSNKMSYTRPYTMKQYYKTRP